MAGHGGATMSLRLDDCVHCAALTTLPGWARDDAIAALERRELGCWLCMEDSPDGCDGHTTCVVLYDGDEPVWDGRCRK